MPNGTPDTQSTTGATGGEEHAVPPVAENIAEPSPHTQAAVRSAEEMLVRRLLGVDLRAEGMGGQSEALLNRILHRVSSILIDTRDQVRDNLDLQNQLRVALQTARVRRHPRLAGEPLSRTRAAEVMEGARRSFPLEVVNELAERLWSTVYRQDPRDYPIELSPNELVIPQCWIQRRQYVVVIDADHPFWKRTDPEKLLDTIEGKNPSQCGMRLIPDTFGRGGVLTREDAQGIIRTLSTTIHLLDTSSEDPVVNQRNGYTVRLKLRHLLSEQMQAGGRGFQNVAQLQAFLSGRRNWARYVEVVPTPRASGNPPNQRDARLVQVLAQRAFQLLAFTAPLGARQARIRNVARHQYALHRFRDSLLKGEVNPWDVATAMTMIEQQGHLADVLSGKENKEEIAHANRRVQLVRYLDELHAFDLPTVAEVPLGWSLERIENEITAIGTDLPNARYVAPPALPLPLVSHFSGVYGGAPTSRSRAQHLRQRLFEKQRELAQAQSTMRRVGGLLERIYGILDALPEVQVGVFGLTPLINPGPPITINPTELQFSTNFQQIANRIRTEFTSLRDEQYYRDELKKLQEKATKAPVGAAGVHSVYEAYFRGKGLSEQEARDAANALMARNNADVRMEGVLREAEREVWPITMNENSTLPRPLPRPGQGSTWLERWEYRLRGADIWVWHPHDRRIRNVVNHVAAALAIPLTGERGTMFRRESTRAPDLTQASFEQLIQLYFALKGLVGASRRMHLPEYEAVTHNFLRDIGDHLARRHARALLYTFKGQLPSDSGEKDEKGKEKTIERLLSQPEKLHDILRKLLEGEAPEAHRAKIEKALARAEHCFEFWRRTLLIDRLVGDKWSIKNAVLSERNPLSMRNINFGRWGVFGAPWRLLKWTVGKMKEAPAALWQERKPMALGALVGTLILPGVGTAVGAGIGAVWRKAAA